MDSNNQRTLFADIEVNYLKAFQIELEFRSVGFLGEPRRKTGLPRQKILSEQGREPTINSTYI